MSAEVASHIFEPFFTTKETGKREGPGVSYGPYHRGTAHGLDLETAPGTGTVFRVYLPAAEGTPEVQQREAAAKASRGGDATILLVEENFTVRSFVETLLQRRGYSMLVCRNPNRAESVFRKAGMKVHLLIISLALPGGRSDHQLATELVKLRPALRVLYTSGSENVDLAQPGLKEGVNLLLKPFQLSQLETIVARLLGSARHGAVS